MCLSVRVGYWQTHLDVTYDHIHLYIYTYVHFIRLSFSRESVRGCVYMSRRNNTALSGYDSAQARRFVWRRSPLRSGLVRCANNLFACVCLSVCCSCENMHLCGNGAFALWAGMGWVSKLAGLSLTHIQNSLERCLPLAIGSGGCLGLYMVLPMGV